jgi:hypothetical protein
MTGDIVLQLIPFVFLAIVVVQVVRKAQRRFRALAAERRIAQRPVTAARATLAPPVAPPATRTTQPVVRMPKRVEPPPARTPRPAAPPPPAPTLLPAAGPRWAANAVVAAEVFGPPLALRPDGTLGSPQAF